MALEKNIGLLGGVPMLVGLTEDQLSMIAGKGKKTYFKEGTVILKAGDKGDTSFLILSGCAVTEPEADSGLESETLETGALLGELGMLVETTHTLTVKAKERVRALSIKRSDLYEVMEADPAIAHHFSQYLLDRLVLLANDLRQVDAQFAALEFSLAQAAAAVA